MAPPSATSTTIQANISRTWNERSWSRMRNPMPSSPASISARMTSTSPRPSATRIPARIIESDAGRMTDRIVRERHICSVRAFSSSTGSSPLTPWNVLIRTGNTAASTTSAIIVVALSMPRNRNSTGTSAGELGSATRASYWRKRSGSEKLIPTTTGLWRQANSQARIVAAVRAKLPKQ